MLLNPTLDTAALAARYRDAQRLQILDVLDPPLADRIWDCLTRETPWGVNFNEDGQNFHVAAEQLRAMTPEQRRAIAAAVQARAKSGYQYFYQAYMMLDNYLAKKDPGLFLHDVLELINGPEMLDFVRAVSGISSVVKADAQATLYAPGQFLLRHNDGPEENMKRRVAYILSFTKDWKPDWGGLLQFYDADEDITGAYVPRFNALSLFTVPQWHAVTAVNAFAPIGRLSITGWFLDP
jgi:Rps23 Pro-64 3,4-dihydroxylase Tpa1-like proline 4-hydroxylase